MQVILILQAVEFMQSKTNLLLEVISLKRQSLGCVCTVSQRRVFDGVCTQLECSDKIIQQLCWQYVNKRSSQRQMFFQLPVPWRKTVSKQNKLIGFSGLFRLVPTQKRDSLHWEKSLLLTRSPQTHGCNQMSFDLHVM